MVDYPGLGMPISQFGWSGGQPALGPFSFLPGAQQSAGRFGGATMINGQPSLNDQEFGGHANTGFGGSSVPSTASGSTTASSGLSPNATNFLNGVIGGQNLPYGSANIGAMKSQASDQAAQAEAANNQRATGAAVRGGASANDPSLQGVLASNQQGRQGDIQRADQAIDAQANQANFAAQMQAAQAENQFNLSAQQIALEQQRLGMQQQQNAMSFLPNLLGNGRMGLAGPHVGGNMMTGSNTGFIGFGGENYNGLPNEETGLLNYPDYSQGNGE